MAKSKMSQVLMTVIVIGLLTSSASFASTHVSKKSEKKSEVTAKVTSESTAVKSKISRDSDDSNQESIADVKDELNSAIGDLKGQVESLKAANSDAKISGTIFYRWQKYFSTNKATAVNNFDLDRAYVDFKKNLTGGAAMRITMDISRLSTATTVKNGGSLETVTANGSSQNLFEFLKYAYVDLPVAIPASLQVLPTTLSFRLGQQQTGWIDVADKVLNLRFIAKSLLDNESVMSSADLGVGALGSVTVGGLPIDYQATALNGSGYKSAETNGQKSLALRLTSTVIDNPDYGQVAASVFYDADGVDSTNTAGTNNFGAAELSLKNDALTVYYEALNGSLTKSINGYSTGILYNVCPRWNAFCRVDQYQPNIAKANDQVNRTFYGMTFDWTKDVKLAADVQNSIYGNGYDGSSGSSNAGLLNSVFYLHTVVNF